MTPSTLEAALGYAARGWLVFPLKPGGKQPVIPTAHPEGDPLHGVCKGGCGREGHGLHDATIDPATITRWWTHWPAANIGLPTGYQFDVLDIDGQDALDALNAWAELNGGPDYPPLEGPTVRTPRGWHVYVAPTGHGNTVNLGGILGLDWRGIGGYVVAPPSMMKDGRHR
jgi:hypothetical protein